MFSNFSAIIGLRPLPLLTHDFHDLEILATVGPTGLLRLCTA
jgi:hypothetical protein